MRNAMRIALGLWLVLAASPAWSEEATHTARVTYVTGSSVYLDAGSDDGLAMGTTLELRRGDERVATIEVREVSRGRAVARVVDQRMEPDVGDTARFAAATTVKPAAGSAEPAPAEARRASRAADLHGRVGVRYLAVDDGADPDGGFTQPSFDVRVDGTRLGGTPWGFDIDLRARRTYRNDPVSTDTSATRAYRFLVSRGQADDGWRFSLGRQLSPHLAALSIFDGFAADYGAKRWGAGVVSGTQPDPADFGFSSDITEHGVYFRFNGTRSDGPQWNVVTGAIGSYLSGDVDREFAYIVSRVRTRRFWVYASQEIDINRDWKVDEAGEDSVEPTSTFLSFSFRPSRTVTLRAGYDNRRNVRLARDRVTPATEFDDAFRRGAWFGLTTRIGSRWLVGADTRVASGGSAGSSSNHGAMVSANGFTARNLGFRARVSRYANDSVEGLFYELDGHVDLASRARLRLAVGRRDDENLVSLPVDETLDWYGISLDLFPGTHWYVTLESERTEGELDSVTQHYLTMSYRF